MSNPSQLRSLYRSLLRELPPRPLAPSTARSPLHQRLRQSFSSDAPNGNAVAQAEQLVQYLKAQRQYSILLERYNPGMNMDDEERTRLSARRVGMNMPKQYVEGGEKA
ncbi:Uu.00g129710.m01.CDS01 [Anthostomella pinea]|uniref:Uu.00g129710.m01.CDS01 n=1 Tax=Anthostomella pinea TaxID=933095 RepID=A0AAI8VIM3_9PEZI|nr:Uu.00g129710.m01.CDS01 [Anthostomella pinea]